MRCSNESNNYHSPVISGTLFEGGGRQGGEEEEGRSDLRSASDIIVVPRSRWSGDGNQAPSKRIQEDRSNSHHSTASDKSEASVTAIATPQTISEFDKLKKHSRTTVTTTTTTTTPTFSSRKTIDSFGDLAAQRQWDFEDNTNKKTALEDNGDRQNDDQQFEKVWRRRENRDKSSDFEEIWHVGQPLSFEEDDQQEEEAEEGQGRNHNMGKMDDPRASPTPGTMTTASGSAASSDVSSPTPTSEMRRKSLTASPRNTTYLLDRDVILGGDGDEESAMGDTTLGATTVGGATTAEGSGAGAGGVVPMPEIVESPNKIPTPSRREYFSLTKHDPEAAIAAATAYKQNDAMATAAARGDSPRQKSLGGVPPPPLATAEEAPTQSPSAAHSSHHDNNNTSRSSNQSPTSMAASIAAANVAYSASTEEGLETISPRNQSPQLPSPSTPRSIPPPPISGADDGAGTPSVENSSPTSATSGSHRHRRHGRRGSHHARHGHARASATSTGTTLPSSSEGTDPPNAAAAAATEGSATERARKSKLEKIRELQTENRGLRAANKALRTQLEEHQWQKQLQRSESGGASPAGGGTSPAGGSSTPPAPRDASSAAVVSNAALILKQKDIIRGQREKHLRNKLELLETRKLCRELKAGREEARTLAMRTQKEIDTLNTEVAGLQRELASTLETLEEAQIEKTQSRTKIVQLNKELSVSIDRIRRLEAEQARLQKTGAAAAVGAAASSSSSTRRLRVAAGDLMLEEETASMKKLREELKAKEEEMEGVKRELKKKTSQVVALEVEVDGLREEVDEVKDRSAKERRTMEERLIRAETASSKKAAKTRDEMVPHDAASTSSDAQNPTPSVVSSSSTSNLMEQLRQDVLNARSEAAKARDDLESKIRKIVSLEVAVENAQEEVEEVRLKYERDSQQWQQQQQRGGSVRGRQREAFQKRLEALEEENRILREQVTASRTIGKKAPSPQRKAFKDEGVMNHPQLHMPGGTIPEDSDAASMGELTAQIECLYQMSLLQGGTVPQSV